MNDNLARDLPGFVFRLAGPDVRTAKSFSDFKSLVTNDFTDTVAFGVWSDELAQNPAFLRLVDRERLHTTFVVADFEPTPEEIKELNPADTMLVSYHNSPTGLQMEGFDLSTIDLADFEVVIANLRNFIEKKKLLRPGHEHDAVNKLVIEHISTTIPEEHCNQRKTKDGEMAAFSIVGRNLLTGVEFANIQDSEVRVGGERGDLPSILTQRALSGMCPTMKRRVIIPPGRGYALGNEPPDVDKDDRLLFEVEMLHWDVADPEAFGNDKAPNPEL